MLTFIDLETGTVINGPIVFIPEGDAPDFDEMSNQEIIDWAEDSATPINCPDSKDVCERNQEGTHTMYCAFHFHEMNCNFGNCTLHN